jgi:hypothetical protein
LTLSVNYIPLARGYYFLGVQMKRLLLIGAIFALSGCAGSLSVSGQNGAVLPGIPIPQSEVYVKTGFFTQIPTGARCEPQRFTEEVSLAVGAPVYINVKPAPFGKTSFSFKAGQTSGLSEFSFNTEQNADAIKAATSAAETLLPFLGILPRVANDASGTAGDRSQLTTVLPTCTIGADRVQYFSFAEYNQKFNR